MWPQCSCGHFNHFLISIAQKTMKFLQKLPHHSAQSYRCQWANAIRIPRSQCQSPIFISLICLQCQCGYYDLFSFNEAEKPWSSYSSCHTTVHNLTTVKEQMRLEFCNFLFKFRIFSHQCDCCANADIMTTFLFQWIRKPWSFNSSCHTTVHNLTAVNEQLWLEFHNSMFEFWFLCHLCDRNANADIMNTF